MALRWLIHSACHVFGYPNDHDHGVMKSGKLISEVGKLHKYPSGGFEMPLHYPRYTKNDYEKMEEWRVDLLLQEYGLCFKGTLDEKRGFAMGTFLWPDQY